jgi:Family of unknown function (DUF5678)
MADTAQSPSPEANWLRQNWNRETLGKYEHKWIAVKNDEITSFSNNLESLLSETIKKDPLYAFVYFGPLQ